MDWTSRASSSPLLRRQGAGATLWRASSIGWVLSTPFLSEVWHTGDLAAAVAEPLPPLTIRPWRRLKLVSAEPAPWRATAAASSCNATSASVSPFTQGGY